MRGRFYNMTNYFIWASISFEYSMRLIETVFIYNCNHSNSTVKCFEHFLIRDISLLLNIIKNAGYFKFVELNACIKVKSIENIIILNSKGGDGCVREFVDLIT